MIYWDTLVLVGVAEDEDYHVLNVALIGRLLTYRGFVVQGEAESFRDDPCLFRQLNCQDGTFIFVLRGCVIANPDVCVAYIDLLVRTQRAG